MGNSALNSRERRQKVKLILFRPPKKTSQRQFAAASGMGIHICVQKMRLDLLGLACLIRQVPADRSASLWSVSLTVVRLDLPSLTCLIRQDSDGNSAPLRRLEKMESIMDSKKKFGASDWRVLFAPETPRLHQLSPPWAKTVQSTGPLPNTSDKNRKTRKKKNEENPRETTRRKNRTRRPPHTPTNRERKRAQRDHPTRKRPPRPRNRNKTTERPTRKGHGPSWVKLYGVSDTVKCLRQCVSARYQSLLFWLVYASLASKAHWPSSLDDDVCVTSESPCATSAPLPRAQFTDAVEVSLLRQLTWHHVARTQPVQYPCAVSS